MPGKRGLRPSSTTKTRRWRSASWAAPAPPAAPPAGTSTPSWLSPPPRRPLLPLPDEGGALPLPLPSPDAAALPPPPLLLPLLLPSPLLLLPRSLPRKLWVLRG